ncbi:MAG: flagellar biosynthesis protein FlgB [Acidimicrobiia bacterium]|nr:flagellar biosynthesis protein FlgB [Acidimicrobiia bacterium]
MVSDPTMRALHASLTGLNMRRKAAEDNIANIETPGYHANKVDFESSLRTAIDRGDPSSMEATVSRSLAPTRMNGNNVAIDEELVGLTETALRHQLVVEAMNGKFRLLRSAIRGQ